MILPLCSKKPQALAWPDSAGSQGLVWTCLDLSSSDLILAAITIVWTIVIAQICSRLVLDYSNNK